MSYLLPADHKETQGTLWNHRLSFPMFDLDFLYNSQVSRIWEAAVTAIYGACRFRLRGRTARASIPNLMFLFLCIPTMDVQRARARFNKFFHMLYETIRRLLSSIHR